MIIISYCTLKHLGAMENNGGRKIKGNNHDFIYPGMYVIELNRSLMQPESQICHVHCIDVLHIHDHIESHSNHFIK